MQSLPKAHEGIRDVSSLPGQQQVKGLLRAFIALRHRTWYRRRAAIFASNAAFAVWRRPG
jgi:hypothetical protein